MFKNKKKQGNSKWLQQVTHARKQSKAQYKRKNARKKTNNYSDSEYEDYDDAMSYAIPYKYNKGNSRADRRDDYTFSVNGDDSGRDRSFDQNDRRRKSYDRNPYEKIKEGYGSYDSRMNEQSVDNDGYDVYSKISEDPYGTHSGDGSQFTDPRHGGNNFANPAYNATKHFRNRNMTPNSKHENENNFQINHFPSYVSSHKGSKQDSRYKKDRVRNGGYEDQSINLKSHNDTSEANDDNNFRGKGSRIANHRKSKKDQFQIQHGGSRQANKRSPNRKEGKKSTHKQRNKTDSGQHQRKDIDYEEVNENRDQDTIEVRRMKMLEEEVKVNSGNAVENMIGTNPLVICVAAPIIPCIVCCDKCSGNTPEVDSIERNSKPEVDLTEKNSKKDNKV